ncbi:hypothetical protein BGLA2_260087 [Burkholderia gladioli]|nr:hypothetical protein BGLA2_260087 [Burkholderia gladioli]
MRPSDTMHFVAHYIHQNRHDGGQYGNNGYHNQFEVHQEFRVRCPAERGVHHNRCKRVR